MCVVDAFLSQTVTSMLVLLAESPETRYKHVAVGRTTMLDDRELQAACRKACEPFLLQ